MSNAEDSSNNPNPNHKQSQNTLTENPTEIEFRISRPVIGTQRLCLYHSKLNQKQEYFNSSSSNEHEKQELDSTGILVWPAAKLLGSFLCKLRQQSFSSILEMGAGTGLVGLSAAKNMICDRVLLIDRNPAAVEILKQNIAANELEDRAEALELDWCDQEAVLMMLETHPWAPFSAVVASDVLYPWGKATVVDSFFSSSKSVLEAEKGEILMSYVPRTPPSCTRAMFFAAQKSGFSMSSLFTEGLVAESKVSDQLEKSPSINHSCIRLLKFSLNGPQAFCSNDEGLAKDTASLATEVEVWSGVFPDASRYFNNKKLSSSKSKEDHPKSMNSNSDDDWTFVWEEKDFEFV